MVETKSCLLICVFRREQLGLQPVTRTDFQYGTLLVSSKYFVEIVSKSTSEMCECHVYSAGRGGPVKMMVKTTGLSKMADLRMLCPHPSCWGLSLLCGCIDV